MDRRETWDENQALFRAVNERIETLNKTFAVLTDAFEVVCECGDPGCIEQIPIGIGAYERARSDATLFITVPGHDEPNLEDIVEKHDDYSLVRKHPALPGRVAEQTDPPPA